MNYQTPEEYLVYLSEELKYLKPKDAKNVLSYYENKINIQRDYGEKDEQIVRNLPSPEKVAEEAYESHGFNYKELRKKKTKQANIFNKILSSIIFILLLICFILITVLSIKEITKLFLLLNKINYLNIKLDKTLILLLTISIFIIYLLLFIYIFDLFYLLMIHFINKIIPIKNERILSFSISGIISNTFSKTLKIKRFNLVLLISMLCITIIIMIVSTVTKGYCYRSLNNISEIKEVIEINNDINKIKINSDTLKINVYSSSNDKNYIEYGYEFESKINKDINNNVLNITIDESSSFDLFDLLKEPTQCLNIYLKDAKDLDIILDKKVDMNILDASINNLYLQCLESSLGIRNTTFNDINFESYNGYIGFAKSTGNKVIQNTTKGQFLISEDTLINNIESDNSSGIIQVKNSTIDTFKVVNQTGSVSLSDVVINHFDLVNDTSIVNIYNSNIENTNITLNYTSQLLFTDSIINNNIIKLNNESYFVCSNVTSKDMNIEANNSNIFIEELEIDNVLIKTIGNNTKTEIETSIINNIDLTHKDGFLFINNTNLSGKVICEASHTVEFKNNDGNIIELYLAKIGKNNSTNSWISLTTEDKKDLVYVIKSWDAYSASCLQKDEKVNVDTSSAYNGDNNE